MKYKTKPFEVEAIQWTGKNIDELVEFAGVNFELIPIEEREYSDDPDATAAILDDIHSTWRLVLDGQWIIKGSKGEFYPCDDEEFRSKYEPV